MKISAPPRHLRWTRKDHRREVCHSGVFPAHRTWTTTHPKAWELAERFEKAGRHVLHPSIHRPHVLIVFGKEKPQLSS